MKTLFIPAKVKSEINEKKIQSLKLPKNIAIAYSIQYKDIASKIKQILSKKHNITKLIQVLGCSNSRFPKQTQAILLISSGKFHTIALATESKIPVYILENNKLTRISEKDIEFFKKKQKASYLKFLHSKRIGILVSTKPSQENLKKAIELKSKIKDKETYLFISNNINTQEFENFPEIQSWINTACPRMDIENNSIINVRNIKS